MAHPYAPIEFTLPNAGFCRTGDADTGVCDMLEGPKRCYELGGIPYIGADGIGMCKRPGSSLPPVAWDSLVAPAMRSEAAPLGFGSDAIVAIASSAASRGPMDPTSAEAAAGMGNQIADDSAPAPKATAVNPTLESTATSLAPPMAPDVKAAQASQAKLDIEVSRVMPSQ